MAATLLLSAVSAAGAMLAQPASASIAGNVYVSPTGNDANPGTAAAPVQTVQQAQTLARALTAGMASDVTVVLEDGFYRMSSPLTLTSADSGLNGHNVVWTADTGAHPVLAGSQQITGWAPMSAGSPIWVAQAPAGLQTRQLYVNGTRAARASGSLPTALTGQDSTGYSGGGSAMAAWRNPSGASPQLEFVYRGGLGAWTEPRCPVASFSGDAVVMAQPCWTNSTTRAGNFPDGRAYNLVGRSSITEQPTSVENAFQFLSTSTPGAWFLDQGDSKVYYVPRAGETMTSADVEAPVLEKLVDGNGSASAPIHNIVFNGIQFSYATWLGPSFHGQGSSDGFSEIQANYQVTGANGAASQGLCHVPPSTYTLGTCPYGAWTQTPGNVSLTYDQNIQFTGDAFVHLGAAGLALGDGSQNDVVKGDVVTDTSANGIEIGNVDMPTATGSSQTSGNAVTDNHVFNLPAEFHGGIGIDSGYTASDTVSHNQIDHTPYTAISQGWGGWPDKEKEAPQPNFSHDNTIANNLIFDHMGVLNDGGAIYTQGITGTSLTNGEHVTGNLIHDQTGSGHVIYTDNGCTFETIKGNAVYNNPTAQAWASEHSDYAPGATTSHDPTDVENNYFQNQTTTGTGGGVTVANNTAITSASQVPSSITANAGLETAYAGLLNWSQAPLPPVGGTVANDFSVGISPASGGVTAGSSVSTSLSTAVTSGSAESVTLSASGLPSGATASFSPASVNSGSSSTLTIATGTSTPAGTYAITVTGTAASGTHTATFTLTVTAASSGNDFSLAASPTSSSVTAGTSASTTVNTAITTGAAESVTLSASGLPTGATASFSPATVNSGASSTLTIATTASTPAGTYTVTLTGSAASGTHTASYALTVTAASSGCYTAWSATASYVPNDQVSYGGHNYTALYWSTDVTPGSAIAWNIWQDNGAC